MDHLIISQDFAIRLSGEDETANAVRSLWSATRQAVIVTCGDQGCWYMTGSGDATPVHYPGFSVQAVDTTGCGDVFHGAYAVALAGNMEIFQRIQFASAAAALKATQRGAQAGIPFRNQVDRFLGEQTS